MACTNHHLPLLQGMGYTGIPYTRSIYIPNTCCAKGVLDFHETRGLAPYHFHIVTLLKVEGLLPRSLWSRAVKVDFFGNPRGGPSAGFTRDTAVAYTCKSTCSPISAKYNLIIGCFHIAQPQLWSGRLTEHNCSNAGCDVEFAKPQKFWFKSWDCVNRIPTQRHKHYKVCRAFSSP